MNEMILVDLETQSFPVESGIYEVACLVIKDYKIIDRLYLAKEIKGYTGNKNYGYGFHDISQDEEYVNQFKNLINKYNYPVIAHNCPFDRKFLTYYDWLDEEYPTYCSMRAIKYANPDLDSYKLSRLIKYYNVGKSVTHKAMDDIENVFELLKVVKPETWFKVGQRKITEKAKARNKDDIDLGVDSTNKLIGEVICFTGTSPYNRVTMQELAISNGAEISKNVIKKTTMLVVGLDAGSKLDKAHKNDIPVISDYDFMRIVNPDGAILKDTSGVAIEKRVEIQNKKKKTSKRKSVSTELNITDILEKIIINKSPEELTELKEKLQRLKDKANK